MVEAALILPILIVLIFSVGALSFAITQNALFTDSVRIAGRTAVAQIGSCDDKRDVARTTLIDNLENHGLEFANVATAVTPQSDDTSEPGPNHNGLQVKVDGKLLGMFDVEYKSFSAFEGGDDC